MKRYLIWPVVVLFSLGFIISCGGGGGGGDEPVNNPPVANSQPVGTNEDEPLAILLSGSDGDGDSITFGLLTSPSHGSLSGTPPQLTYTPDLNYNGTDSFTFKVNDGLADSPEATCSISITSVNDAPSGVADSGTTEANSPITIDVLSNDSDVDGDTLSVSGKTSPLNGTVIINLDDSLTYTPDSDFNGTNIFTYSLSDGQGASDVTSVSITVLQPPSIGISPNALSFIATAGGPNPAYQALSVNNIGESILRWTIISDKPWISFYPTFDTNAGEEDSVSVSANVIQSEAWTGITTFPWTPDPRYGHSAIWTGSEMIMWGGFKDVAESVLYPLNDGALYDPVSNTWFGTTSTIDAPVPRNGHSAVWTGNEMIIWGGDDGFGLRNDGGAYNPFTNTWRSISTNNAPSERELHSAVWTGSEMLVWGGYDGSSYFNDGAIYNPVSDAWEGSISTTDAPSERMGHKAVWTGTDMIIWGGRDAIYRMNDGARYDPVSDLWIGAIANTNAPTPRALHSCVWTGEEMIVWGGWIGGSWQLPTRTNTGARYDLVSNQWVGATSTDFGDYRAFTLAHSGIWTGQEMILWAGKNGGISVGKYVPPINLATGIYNGTLTVGDPRALNHPQSVSIVLSVN